MTRHNIDLFALPSCEPGDEAQQSVANRIQQLREALGEDAGRYGPDELAQLARDDVMFHKIAHPA